MIDLWRGFQVTPGAIAIAEDHLRRALPPVAIVTGLAGLFGSSAELLMETGNYRVWSTPAYVALVALGAIWLRRPPARAHLAASCVGIFLATAIGSLGWASPGTGSLTHLGVLSVGTFYFLVDRRHLVAVQLYALFWFAGILLQAGSAQGVYADGVLWTVTWLGGLALHLGRARGLEDLDEARRALEVETLERQRAQEKWLAAQKLESLGVMAGGVAHDFNNLLVGIVAGTDLALAAREDRDKLEFALGTIRSSSLSARDLCGKMLDFAGGAPMTLVPVDLNVCVEEGAQLAEAGLPASVVLEKDLADGLPPIQGDPTQLRQAVVNLVTNAAEAMEADGGGRIRVATEILPGEAGDCIVVRVHDDGPGVPAEIRGRIFDPFFTTKFTGRGLGLAQVAGAVRSHGAEIESMPTERGACFEIRIPAERFGDALPPEIAADDDEAWRGTGRVLLVDDEPLVRKAARLLLELLGFEVQEVRDGAEAVAALAEEPVAFRFAIVDATMPGQSGRATILQLREIAPDFPILLSSGYADGAERERLSDDVDVPFLGKPYGRAELVRAIRSLLGEALAR